MAQVSWCHSTVTGPLEAQSQRLFKNSTGSQGGGGLTWNLERLAHSGPNPEVGDLLQRGPGLEVSEVWPVWQKGELRLQIRA